MICVWCHVAEGLVLCGLVVVVFWWACLVLGIGVVLMSNFRVSYECSAGVLMVFFFVLAGRMCYGP